MSARAKSFRSAGLAILAVAAIGAASSAPAPASTGSEEREGASILRSVENGQRTCGKLSGGDLEKVGDYVMGRMVGSTAGHEKMDSLMKSTMGGSATEQMHVVMGRRFTGCGGGRVPGSFGSMMGVMGMMGGGASGMMGGYDGDGRSGSMMGGLRSTSNSGDDDDFGAAGWVMVAMMGLLMVFAAVAFFIWRPSRRAPSAGSALDILRQRYASGEIDGEEFERRRRALGGAS